MFCNRAEKYIDDLFGDGRAVKEVLHRLCPVLHPQAGLDRPPSLCTTRIGALDACNPITQLGGKCLGILLVLGAGIGLAKTDPESHPIEGENPFTVVTGLVKPVDYIRKDNRLESTLHVPAQVEQKRLIDHIVCDGKNLLQLRGFIGFHIRGHGIPIIQKADACLLCILVPCHRTLLPVRNPITLKPGQCFHVEIIAP